MSTISLHTALVYSMVVAAVADGKLKDSEVESIAEFVRSLPVFDGYDAAQLRTAIGDCSALLDADEGLDAVLGLVKEAVPASIAETAYCLACDIVAVDGAAGQEELRWLEMMRHELGVSRLHAAAIERGSRARYARV